jgi:SpoVK/Ycf46/Vps4 family AAA+-type ATPase
MIPHEAKNGDEDISMHIISENSDFIIETKSDGSPAELIVVDKPPVTNSEVEMQTVPISESKQHHFKFNVFEKFSQNAYLKVNQELYHKLNESNAYIAALEKLLSERGIPLPDRSAFISAVLSSDPSKRSGYIGLLKTASMEELHALLEKVKKLRRKFAVTVKFKDFGVWTLSSKKVIPTVGTALKRLILGAGHRERSDILKGLTGRIAPQKLTLLLGPPGCGKSVFLKSLAGRMNSRSLRFDGEVYYNDEPIHSPKFIIPKV